MLIFRLIARHITRRLLQSILFVIGVALGVAVGVAIDLANSSASRAFSLSTESLTGRTTHQIVGGPSGVDEAVYRQLRAEITGVDSAPIIETYVRGVSLGDQPLRMLGVNIFAENPFRDYAGVSGGGRIDLDAFNALLVDSGSVFISQSLADRFNLVVGDAITLRVNTQQVDVQIGGLLQPNDTLTQQALDDLLLIDLSAAQNLLGEDNRLTRIDLALPESFDLRQIEATLPPGVVLTTPRQQNDALDQMTDAFEINLQALSLLALVVGVFLIYNTVMFSVVQRRPVIGILRSLGTSKGQIFALVIGEAALLGAIGTLMGLGLGIIMGRGTVGAVSQSISDIYFRVNVQGITITPFSLLRGAIIGLVASLVAAIVPSIDATRTSPAGSMRRSDVEQSAAQLIPYMTGAGLLLIIGGLGVMELSSTSIVLSFTSLFMIVVGAALFTPLGMVVLMRLSAPVMGLIFGVVGRMAARALVRTLSRTSVAVAALTLAVSVIVGVGVMISSFRSTVEDWLDNTLGADIFISTPNLSTDSTPDIDPAIIALLEDTEGVQRVAYVRDTKAIAPDYPELPPAQLIAVNEDISGGQRRFAWTNVPAGEDYRARIEQGQVTVTESFAFRRGITPENNHITLLTDAGPQAFEVFGAFYDYASDQGVILMDYDVFRRYFDDPYITSMGVFIEEEADLSAVIDTLRTETLVGQDLEVQSNRELREGALEVFDRTFSITAALQVLAIIVAFIGILSALIALQLEHVREYGIMRANGMTPWQLRRFTLLQTGLMGTVSGLMALPIGLALAMILIRVINVRSFGWSMPLTLPPREFIQAFAVAIVSSLLAGVYPAWRVGKIRAVEALRSE
jgi:putative ABC transport system permease protein